ncbi:MAG TPA: sulfite exporter TauE/SafE family protein, partial [Polyangiaceae bacterium]|nr:sulfite exporter TauE/SafE family protein [Polyangiaceae bacterium]
MSTEPWILAVLVLAGLIAGFVNTMAGGGSLLTLPALMLLGLPADIANGTNRLSVLSQSLSGVLLFHKEEKLDRRAIVPVLAPTVSGSLVGAVVASRVPRHILELML